MNPHSLPNLIMLAVGRGATRLWRNNVAMAWAGSGIRKITRRQMVECGPGDVVVRQARPIHAGLCKGSSDLVGLTSVVVTPDMVGRRVAVFVAIEAKTGKGRPTKDQRQFVEFVNTMGGRAGVAWSAEEAAAIVVAANDNNPEKERS